jgi:hypothetical protein
MPSTASCESFASMGIPERVRPAIGPARPNRTKRPMYLHTRLFRRALRISLIERPFRLRRWAYVLFFTGLFLAMWLLVALGRALDHVFFPGFRRQPVTEPLFVVAPPRSGTTLTQKLLALDEKRFVHSRLYQTIFPCVLYQRLIQRAFRLDELVGRPLGRLVAWAERRFFGGWDNMHKMRFDEPEEDDGYFVYPFVTEAVFLLFPYVDELWEAGFADALPAAERRRLMRYYRSCLQRQLYAHGPGKTVLAKATQLSGAVHALLEEFPDARLVTLVRHPEQAVASHVSVFYRVWQAHSPEIAKDSDVSRAYARLATSWYRHLCELRADIDPGRFSSLAYRDLVSDPRAAIEGIYEHFGWTPSAAFRARLAAASAVERRREHGHHYTLEEFGLSKAWIRDQLGDVLDAYGLEA